MEYVGDGVYTIPNVTIGTYFAFVTSPDFYYRIYPNNKINLGNGGNPTPFVFGEPNKDNAWVTPPGNALSNYEVTLNLKNPSVRIEDNGSIPPVPSYTHIFMSTNVSGNSTYSSAWKHGIELAKGNGNVYTGIVKAENNASIGNYVYFFDKRVSEWPKDRENGYGAGTGNLNVTDKKPEQLNRGESGYFKLPERGTYFVKFDLDKNEVTFTKDNEGDKFVYFNVGQTYYSLSPWTVGDNRKTPYAFFDFDGVAGGVGVEMQLIDAELPLFRAKIPEGANGFSRVCTINDLNAVGENIAYKRKEILKIKKEQNVYEDVDVYDETKWDEYIYVADLDDDETNYGKTIFVQSHIGIDKYYELRAKREESSIYILGLKGWKTEQAGDYTIINSNEGVFIEQIFDRNDNFNVDDKSKKFSRTFKMSYIYPLSLTQDRTNLRLWADFNLGLIGPNFGYYDKDGNGLSVEMGTAGRINNVRLQSGTTIPFNTYNQHNWWINEYPGSYWLVIDIDYHTATLLNFPPLPTIKINPDKDLTIDDLSKVNAEIEDIVVPGSDEYDTTGANIAHFRFVNSLSATGILKPADSSSDGDFLNRYKAEYDLSYNNESVGMFEPEGLDDQNITVQTVVPETTDTQTESETVGDEQQPHSLATEQDAEMFETENKFTARGYYTSYDRYDVDGNNLVFRSWTTKNAGEMKIEHHNPERPEIIFFELYNSDSSEEGYYDALIGIGYELPHRFVNDDNHEGIDGVEKASISIYPSFEVYVEADDQIVPAVIAPKTKYIESHTRFLSGVSNVKQEEYVSGFNGFRNDYPDGFCKSKYVFPNEEETTNIGEGSWVYRSINTSSQNENDMRFGYLPLYAPSVIKAGSEKPIAVTAKIIGMYPYRVYAEGNISINPAESKIRLLDDTDPIDTDPNNIASRIVTVDMPSEISKVQFNSISEKLSGVENIAIDDDSSFRLYNLQGVRVLDENPAPGIYIRRYTNGTAKKVFIR